MTRMEYNQEKRLCEICKKQLSAYNPSVICFCHDEHPLRKAHLMYNESHSVSKACGHPTPSLNKLILDYYGNGGPWYVF